MRKHEWNTSAAALVGALGLALLAAPAVAVDSPHPSADAMPATATSGGKSGGMGENVFKTAAPPCATCHNVKAGASPLGPSLAGLAARAQKTVTAPGYKGKAKDARAYIKESITDPNVYLVPGAGFASGGKSLMPATYGQSLTPEQLNQLVDYLMTLK